MGTRESASLFRAGEVAVGVAANRAGGFGWSMSVMAILRQSALECSFGWRNYFFIQI